VEDTRLPFYAKAALIAVAGFGLIYALYICQGILLPLIYSTIFAILLNPFVNFLVRRRINRTVANFIAVLLFCLLMLGLLFLISKQVVLVAETFPELKAKVTIHLNDFLRWISVSLNIKMGEINGWVKNTEEVTVNDLGPVIGRTLMSLGGTIFTLILMPVYLFLILHYKALILEFIRKVFQKGDHSVVVEVLGKSKAVIQRYLVGLLLEMLVVALLNTAGLLILDIDYAIILGITGALLNLIPYLGGIVAVVLPMTIAFVTKDSVVSPMMVFALYTVVQYIDNNIIVPKIVASKVKINALVSIVVVIIGGALWGIPGMFLSIPLTAIMKVVFDHIEIMKPWGYLLGDIVPTSSKFIFTNRKKVLPQAPN
jgi:predicted PurR-regulated permease PerM